MILAAGRGTRLGALGASTPKVLVDVGGEPLLRRHLRYLARQGLMRVVINAHHLADRLAAFVDAYDGELDLVLVREPDLLGTAGGVRNALDVLGPGSFLVLYGDVLITTPLEGLVLAHRDTAAEATVAVYPTEQIEGKGVVALDEHGRVRSFVEKGRAPAAAAFVNAGVYVLEPSFVAEMTPAGVEADFGHDVFPAALVAHRRVFGFVLPEPVIDVGTPDALEVARGLTRP
jgi:NDP-sugar pyrophosphorylase family protein